MGGGGGIFKQIIPIAASALGAYFLGPMIAAGAGVSAAAGTAAGGAIGGLAGQAVSGGAQGPGSVNVNMPGPTAATEMPQIGGTETQAAQTKTLSALRQRQGRAASILSQGGLDNTSSKLGG